MNTPEELKNFEAKLAAMQPDHSRVDQDHLMFEAGRTAGTRNTRPWQGLSGILAVALAGSLTLHAIPDNRPEAPFASINPMAPGAPDPVIENAAPVSTDESHHAHSLTAPLKPAVIRSRIRHIEPEPMPEFPWMVGQPPEPKNYHELRQLVLEQGIGALPNRHATSRSEGRSQPPSTRDIRQWQSYLENLL